MNVRTRGLRNVCMTILLALTTWCQAATIKDIVVKGESGKAAPEQLVRANMRSAPGMVFQPGLLSEDIKRLYKTGAFGDVRTEVQNLGNDQVVIVVIVVSKPVVREIIIEGNRKVKAKALRKLIEHEVGIPVNETTLASDVGAVRKKYRDSGYYETTVETVIQQVPNTNDANLIFRINEEQRAKLKAVKFAGNAVFKSRKLKKSIASRRSWWHRVFRIGGYFDAGKLQMDEDMLTEKYGNLGYLDFKVVEVKRIYNKKKTWVTLEYHLDEGLPYTVTDLTISGNERFSEDELRPLVRQTASTLFNAETEDGDVNRLRHKYEVLGYLDLRVIPQHKLNSGSHTVAIEYRIVEGEPCHVRDIFISGNDVTKDHVIRRELAILPGDLGDMSKIKASKSRLMNLNYFEAVEVSPLATEKGDERDLQIRVKEKKTGQLMLGAGFSSEDAVMGFMEVTQANFDWRNWPTFRGGGQRLRLRTQLGTESTNFNLSFTEPWWFHRRLRLDLDAFYTTRDQGEYDQTTYGVGARVSRPWMKFWRQSVGLRIQEIKLDDFDDTASAELLDEEGSYCANMITFGVSRDTRNRSINPSRGSRLSLSADFETEAIGSYSNIYRLNFNGTKYFGVFNDSVIKLRLNAGIVDDISGDPVAIFDRFFTGGAYSVRGFERREISPVDINEESVGGRSMLTGSVEYIYPIFERIRGSIFCDAGNVWRDVDDINPGEMNISVGVGVQIDLPIGPIRLDYGWPVVEELEHLDGNGRLHFNLGYVF